MRHLIFTLLAVFAPSPPALAGAFPYAAESVTLENGLRVVLVPMDSPGLVAYYTAVRVGSRNEVEAGHTGFAHFFEHMMFRGTKKYPQFDSRMAELGWHNNAFTSDDQTVYTDFGPSDGLAAVIELEADRFQNLDYPEPAFRTEALAVLGEYNKSASQPWMKLEETLNATAFTKHTYRHTTMGFLEDIKAMPEKYAYSKKFHQRFYRPDNCVVFVAGDFGPGGREGVLAEIRKHYGPWKGKADLPKIPVEPAQKGERRATVKWTQETLPRVLIGYKTPAAGDWKASAAQDVVYAYLLGETGTLHRTLVLEQQIAEPFMAWSGPHRDPALWSFVATGKSADALPKVEAALDAAVADLQAGKVDTAQLERIKSNRKYGLILGLEDPEKVAETLAWNVSITGELDSIDRYMDALTTLSVEDVAAFAKQYLVKDGRTVVTLEVEVKP